MKATTLVVLLVAAAVLFPEYFLEALVSSQ